MIEPLLVSETVACPAAHAFHTWTALFGTWWPRGHTVTGHPDAKVRLEPRSGGRLYERTPDGTEVDWGWITTWEPPHRLAYRWHIRRDPDEATLVDVTFVDLGDGSSRIDIVQSDWAVLGAEARQWRDANRAGWDGLLPHLAAACLVRPRLSDLPATRHPSWVRGV